MKKHILLFYTFLFLLLTTGCRVNEVPEPQIVVPSKTEPSTSDHLPTEILPESIEIEIEPKRYLFSFPVEISSTKQLDIVLVLQEPIEYYTSEITEIFVYDGDTLLQTITKEDIPEVDAYAWDGLFYKKGDTIGEPDVRDLNFDGSDDFGLLAVESYPQHIPYSYFIWDPDTQQFIYRFTAFGMDALYADEENRQLIETSYEGVNVYKKYFTVRSDGSIVLSNHKINMN